MSASDDTPSLDERGLALYGQLPARATDGSALAVLYLDYLIGRLRVSDPRADPDLRAEAAGEAILNLIENPSSYDPGRLRLSAFLLMAARGDLRNALAKERRRTCRQVRLDDVADGPDAGKHLGRDDDPSRR